MKEQSNPRLYAIRHSLAHVLAQAVKVEFPQAKLGFGPPTDTGFYYDFDFGEHGVTAKDFKKLERTMRRIIAQRQEFKRVDLDFAAALRRVKDRDEPYKELNIKQLSERGVQNFSFYQNGDFEDLCEGPHVAHTGELPSKAFKLDRVAGAYWLGDESQPMLTRIYALAFVGEEELTDFLKRREVAEKFDHRKLGKELGIYHFDNLVGKGLPLWLPNGFVLRDEIEKYAKEIEFKAGYQRVHTPVLAKKELYLTSQHLPAYEDSMFPPIVCEHEGDEVEHLYLRPMNCPHHHLIYRSTKRSYRELPLRLAEYGHNFRYEQSGELSGLIRVRGMCLNDAHIYLPLEQVGEEMKRILALYREVYETFKLEDYYLRLSLRSREDSDKYQGDASMWEKAEALLSSILEDSGLDFVRAEGEAAFYGPKIDIQFKNLMGREETVSTIQLDFLSPQNFDLTYIDAHGQEQRPVLIHRAPLSTLERFISFLLEYYGGAFPTWLAPIQTVIIPVQDSCLDYCRALVTRLQSAMVRAELDDSTNSFGKKIRNHTVRKIPIILIVGANEVKERQVTVRRYGVKEQKLLSQDSFVDQVLAEIKERRNDRQALSSIV